MKFVEVEILQDLFGPKPERMRRLVNVNHITEVSLAPHSEVPGGLINCFYMVDGARHWVSAEDHMLIMRAIGCAVDR